LATPNYGYEKRQRELAKKQKKEEKLRAKASNARHGATAEAPDRLVAEEGSGPAGSASGPGDAAQPA